MIKQAAEGRDGWNGRRDEGAVGSKLEGVTPCVKRTRVAYQALCQAVLRIPTLASISSQVERLTFVFFETFWTKVTQLAVIKSALQLLRCEAGLSSRCPGRQQFRLGSVLEFYP